MTVALTQAEAALRLARLVARLTPDTSPRNRFGKLAHSPVLAEHAAALGRAVQLPSAGDDIPDTLARIARRILTTPSGFGPPMSRTTLPGLGVPAREPAPLMPFPGEEPEPAEVRDVPVLSAKGRAEMDARLNLANASEECRAAVRAATRTALLSTLRAFGALAPPDYSHGAARLADPSREALETLALSMLDGPKWRGFIGALRAETRREVEEA